MANDDFTYNDFIHYKNVSRETFLHLQNFAELLKKWQKTINLISVSTVSDIWIRHIIDSAQLIDFIAEDDAVLDIGSGAGFPGLILAILGVKRMTMVESDARKAAFLREAARIAQVNVAILNQRVEENSLHDFSLITARGFAPVAPTLSTLERTLEQRHKLLLLKGKKYRAELEEAQKTWAFSHQAFPSITDKDSVVLTVQNPTRRPLP